MKKVEKRVLISYDDLCPYQCKHCYTLDIDRLDKSREIEEIVDSIEGAKFDIVYVSQRRENFIKQDQGIELCEKVFERYKCNILIITRNVFTQHYIDRLKELQRRMDKIGKRLFVAVSIFATKSFALSENPNKVPSPYERIKFLEKMSQEKIETITLIRPVFPNSIVPIEELYEIVDLCSKFSSCVVSSGLAVNDNILWRLGLKSEDFCYVDNMDYLEGAMEGKLRFVNVSRELSLLKQHCKKDKVKCFDHTMEAINFYLEKD